MPVTVIDTIIPRDNGTFPVVDAANVGSVAPVVNVKDFGAIGDGIANDHAAIANAIATLTNGGTVYFPAGTYSVAQTIVVNTSAIVLQGAGAGAGNTISSSVQNVSKILFTGSGDAVFFDGGASGGAGALYGCGLADLLIAGNVSCTNCLRLRNCHHSSFRRYRTLNCSSAGTKTEFAISNIYEQPRHSSNENNFIVTPTYGMWLGSRAPGDTTTSSKITNPIMEGVHNGILDDIGNNSNNIEGGTCEGCDGYGIIINGSINGCFSGMDLEANGTGDILVVSGSFGHSFISMLGISPVPSGGLHFEGGSYLCSIIGGEYYNINIDSTALDIHFAGAPAVINAVTDNGTNTVGSAYSNTQGLIPFKMPGGANIKTGATITGGTTTDTLDVTGASQYHAPASFLGNTIPTNANQAVQVVDTLNPSTQRAIVMDLDSTDTFGGSTVGAGYIEYLKEGVGYAPIRLNPVGGGIGIGPGNGKITSLYQGTLTWNPGTIASLGINNTTVVISGVALGDRVFVTPQTYPGFSGFFMYAYISSSNTIVVNILNGTGAPQVWSSTTFNIDVWR